MHQNVALPQLPAISGVEFKLIADWPGYAVSDDGRVWSAWVWRHRVIAKSWRELKAVVSNKSGHVVVTLCRDGKCVNLFVHRLVLEAFVGPCPNGMQGCHFPDQSPSNCALSNLRWDTAKGNASDRTAHGNTFRGESHPNSKLTEAIVRQIRQRYSSGLASQEKIAKELGISQTLVGRIVRGDMWRHAS